MPTPIQHAVPLIAQPTDTSCWAAATAMLTGRTVNEVIVATPPDLLLPDGSIRNYSEHENWLTGTRRFAEAHGLQFAAPQSWSIAGLYDQLRRGPMVFDLLWQVGGYGAGVGSPGHMVCLTGMSGNEPDATITYNDPLPVNEGFVGTDPYATLVQRFPALTYRVFWR